jgi:transposase
LGRLRCSVCGSECPGYDTLEQRTWRHLDTCEYKTYLVCSVPRVQCPTDGVRVAKMAWAEPGSHFTISFECHVILALDATKVQSKVAGLLRISFDEIHHIMKRAVERGFARRSADMLIEQIALDEKSIGCGHEYLTVLSDTRRGTVIDVAETRTTEATVYLLRKSLSSSQRKKVRCVTMDMWKPFASAVKKVLGKAEIAHDRFHITGYLNEAVDNTRKAEHAALLKEGSSLLTKSKYLWLKNPENLTEHQNALFVAIMKNDLTTPKVWQMKDAFREFFACKTVTEAQAFFDNWYEAAVAIGNRYLTKVAIMLKKHLPGLLMAIKHKATNAMAEAINSKIQALKTSARGYRRFANYRNAILFFHGGLSLYP